MLLQIEDCQPSTLSCLIACPDSVVESAQVTFMNNEIVLKKTPFLFFKRLVVIEFVFALLPIVAVLLPDVQEGYEGTSVASAVSFDLLITLIITILQIAIIVVSFTTWYLPFYRLTRQVISYHRGGLYEERSLMHLASVGEIEIRQGPLAGRFNYGSLVLHTIEGNKTVEIKDIANPGNHADQIRTLVKEAVPRQALPKPNNIQGLITEGENQFVEYKSSLMWDYRQQKVNKNLYEPVMKNVAGFMNARGGTVLIGIDDEGGVLGLEPDFKSMKKGDADGFENVFNMAFNSMVGVEYRQFVDVAFPVIEEKAICMVFVRPADRPAFLLHKGTEKFFVRAGNASQPLSIRKATEYIQSHFVEG